MLLLQIFPLREVAKYLDNNIKKDFITVFPVSPASTLILTKLTKTNVVDKIDEI